MSSKREAWRRLRFTEDEARELDQWAQDRADKEADLREPKDMSGPGRYVPEKPLDRRTISTRGGTR